MKLLQDLLIIPSQSGHEANIIEFICNLLNQNNVTVYRQDANAVACIAGKNRKRAIIFNGHVDTVSEGEPGSWSFDPFAAKIVDKKVYGLGASDMKAGVAALLDLALEYQQRTPVCDLWFSFVVGEEVDGRGTQSFLNWFFTERHNEQYQTIEAVIAEPTNNEFVGIGHRGNAFLELTILGDAGHASAKNNLKTLVIPATAKVVSQIQQLEQSWHKKYHHDYLGVPTIGITSVKSGNMRTPNQIASTCTITLDIRTTPLLHENLTTQINAFTKKLPYEVSYDFLSVSPAGWCPENSLLRSIFSDHWPELDQHIMNGSADQCFFSQRGIPAVIFGPGQRDRMHSTDEYFNLTAMTPYQSIIRKLTDIYGDDR
jgi:acetylornithine deacetylase/succinyl-diaminopimelate desuccinylase-like protein